MSADILSFPHATPPIQPIAHFIRIGEAHKRLSDLHAAERLPAKRVVIDTSRFRYQKELIDEFRKSGAEIVLDTEVAELAAPAKFQGQVRNAPWAAACDGKPLGPQHFAANASTDVIGQIARFAVENRIDAVLAPTHFLSDPLFSGWFSVDRAACLALRAALDREGGSHIAIDYPVIHSHAALNDGAVRSELLNGLADLPFDNVWMRASGLENNAGPLTTKRFLSAMSGLHNLGKPIIIDYLNGLTGAAALAFGVVSGAANGIEERERFDARLWHKPPPERNDDDNFGRTVRIVIPGYGRSFTIKELELLASARGGKKLVACGDRKCCLHGLPDMISDHREHAAYQSFSAIESMAAIPDLNRERYFLNGPLKQARRRARMIKDLRPTQKEADIRGVDLQSLLKRTNDHSGKINKLYTTLERYHESRADGAPRARAVSPRKQISLTDEEKKK